MRRDEQVYKAPNRNDAIVSGFWNMYRHYAGGDEFFFILAGDVYDAIGFLNRLADRLETYSVEIRNKIFPDFIPKHMDQKTADSFKLSFAAVVTPIQPGDEPANVLEKVLNMITRAKNNERSRLLVVFDDVVEDLFDHAKALEEEGANIRGKQEKGSRSQGIQFSDDQTQLNLRAALLNKRLSVMQKAQQLFAVQPVDVVKS